MLAVYTSENPGEADFGGNLLPACCQAGPQEGSSLIVVVLPSAVSDLPGWLSVGQSTRYARVRPTLQFQFPVATRAGQDFSETRSGGLPLARRRGVGCLTGFESVMNRPAKAVRGNQPQPRVPSHARPHSAPATRRYAIALWGRGLGPRGPPPFSLLVAAATDVWTVPLWSSALSPQPSFPPHHPPRPALNAMASVPLTVRPVLTSQGYRPLCPPT